MESVTLEFLSLERGKSLALVTLARPEASNALNGEMIACLLAHLKAVEAKGESCRALVLRAKGKHFSAGADLEWMKKSAALSYEENREESRKLADLFAALSEASLPTLALVQGAVYGGAVGLVGCCDLAIALEGARFCLSEVKVGLLPATILPYLARRMRPGELRRYGLSARPFSAQEALQAGLVQRVVGSETERDAALREELGALLSGEPRAQRIFKALHREIARGSSEMWKAQEALMVKSIAEARVSESGQKGLRAFFERREPEWIVQIPGDWTLPVL